ncbi:uncharacterized protein ACMZJ9_019117 [Mantella aurantiaca]
MEAVYQHANESRLNYKVPKELPLSQVWDSLWEQCEEANEGSCSQKTCFPRAHKKLPNIMKMLAVFQAEVKERSSNSENPTSDKDLCVDCGSSKSKQKLLEENFKRRGELIEYLLSQTIAPSPINEGLQRQAYQPYPYIENGAGKKSNGAYKGTSFNAGTQRPEVTEIPITKSASLHARGPDNLASHSHAYMEDVKEEDPYGKKIHGFKPSMAISNQLGGYSLERVSLSKENITRTLLDFLTNFTKYDPGKDPFTNMTVFENECSQHNLGPRESCLMMKLWLPSPISARLSAPVASPAGGPQFWSSDYHWGDALDRVKALTHVVTGEDTLGTDILEEFKVTSQDDPWEFAKKFEQAYRLVMAVHDPKPTPAMLKALVNKFSFVDRLTHMAASKEKTIEGVVRQVDSYQRDSGLKAAPLWNNEVKPFREVLMEDSIPRDEQPMRWRRHTKNHQCPCSGNHENIEGIHIDDANPQNDRENLVSAVVSKAT